MWFKFPPGVEAAQIELQDYRAEYRDEKGSYFRASDHFAPKILQLPGFEAPGQPEGAPGDLPDGDIERGNAIEALGLENSALRARLAEIAVDRDTWKLRAIEAETKLGNAEADLEELRKPSKDNAENKAVETAELGSKAKK